MATKKCSKKKETELQLKSDSYVVESNVHFPTDYNLLWDCLRCSLRTIKKIGSTVPIEGWRKAKDWETRLKSSMREVGQASKSGGKNKTERLEEVTTKYLTQSRAVVAKLIFTLNTIDFIDTKTLVQAILLEDYIKLAIKHIDLLERRVIKKEKIPHSEKMFSIFETYTEWINKGKSNPNVELGKKLTITTDQDNLIVDYYLMDNQQDRDIVVELSDRILEKYDVKSWSFDKGYWSKDNKQLLSLEIENVIIPKLGKRNKEEQEEETSKIFKRLKNKHSAIESNINELEHRGLDRCPDRGIDNFTKYIGLGVCAYNLKKIGKELSKQKIKKVKKIA